MFLIILYVFILKLDPSISHFVPHTDFQKVGDAVFNNEKYNILKISTHSISDFFENSVLRTKNDEFPSKRLFVDDNGFRHYWSGFEKKNKSLRKTEIITDPVDNILDNVNDAENPPDVVTDKGKNQNSFESTTTEGDDIEVVTKKTHKEDKAISGLLLRKGKKEAKTEQKEVLEEKNVIQTTFYCPFFGVITLSTFADP